MKQKRKFLQPLSILALFFLAFISLLLTRQALAGSCTFTISGHHSGSWSGSCNVTWPSSRSYNLNNASGQAYFQDLGSSLRARNCSANAGMALSLSAYQITSRAYSSVVSTWSCSGSSTCPAGWFPVGGGDGCGGGGGNADPSTWPQMCYYYTIRPGCSRYSPTYRTVACGANPVVSAVSDSEVVTIVNRPANIINQGDFEHCDASDPMLDPPHTGDDRELDSQDSCAFNNVRNRTCGNIKTDLTFTPEGSNTFSCYAQDYDADNGFDTLTYGFEVRKQGATTEFTECQNSFTPISGSDGQCKKEGNQVTLEASSSNARYEMRCLVYDGGTEPTDMGVSVIEGGSTSCGLQPASQQLCPGESGQVTAATSPDLGTPGLSTSWTIGSLPNTQADNVATLNPGSSDIGNHEVKFNTDFNGEEASCSATVRVPNPSCSVTVSPNDRELIIGDEATIKVSDLCLVDIKKYSFEIYKDGGSTPETAGDCDTSESAYQIISESGNSLKIKLCQNGNFTAAAKITQNNDTTVSCKPADLGVAAGSSQWWER